jgi:hypothetical protein
MVPENVVNGPIQRVSDELQVAPGQVATTHDERNVPHALAQRGAVDARISFIGYGKNRYRHRYRSGAQKRGKP